MEHIATESRQVILISILPNFPILRTKSNMILIGCLSINNVCFYDKSIGWLNSQTENDKQKLFKKLSNLVKMYTTTETK